MSGSTYESLALPDHISLPDKEMLEQSQTFLAHMQKRHSVRDFSERQISRDVIENCIAVAGSAPSGANQQPWHFAAISARHMKSQIRAAAEEEERTFYAGGGGDEWIAALEPIGTNAHKPHLEIAPWLIVVFAQRYGVDAEGNRYKHYYVNESVGIATGFLIAALHQCGLSTLTHTPNPMKFLNPLLERPANEKPVMIIAVGHAAPNATVPAAAKRKKNLNDIMTVF